MAKKTETRKLFDRDVLEQLGAGEALELHDQAQKTAAQADELEERLQEHVREAKTRIAALRGEADRDRAAAAKRERLISRKCYERLEGTQVYVLRADTDEVIDQRAATQDELQESFAGLDGGGDLPDDADYSPDPNAPTSTEERKTRRPRKAKP